MYNKLLIANNIGLKVTNNFKTTLNICLITKIVILIPNFVKILTWNIYEKSCAWHVLIRFYVSQRTNYKKHWTDILSII